MAQLAFADGAITGSSKSYTSAISAGNSWPSKVDLPVPRGPNRKKDWVVGRLRSRVNILHKCTPFMEYSQLLKEAHKNQLVAP